jgi:hypothetical protein
MDNGPEPTGQEVLDWCKRQGIEPHFIEEGCVTLSADHRAIDGALGTEPPGTFKDFVEEPGKPVALSENPTTLRFSP